MNTYRPRFAPTRLLITAAAILLLPLALLELVLPGARTMALLAAVGLGLVAVADLVSALRRAQGVSAVFRPLTRLVLGRAAGLEVEVEAAAAAPRALRFGLLTPPELPLEEAEVSVVFPAPTPAADRMRLRISWRVQPTRRGVYQLEKLFVETRSTLGWWHVRWLVTVPASGEVRVYPNLLRESRRLAALFLRRPAPGWRQQRQIGRGREFEQLREYLPGDGFDEIHWKATAKRGHPVTKMFQVERTQEIYAIVDASRLSDRRSSLVDTAGAGRGCDDTLLERQVNAALAVGLAAEKQRDLFGLATFTDRPRGFVRAKSGPGHFQACREALVRLLPQPVSPDFREVCTFLRARLTKRALLVIFSSLDDPALAEDFVNAAALIARRHLVLVIAPLPHQARPLFTGEAPETLDGVYTRLAGHLRWQGLQDLAARLHRASVRLALLGRDELAAGAVAQYMALKQRQAI